MTTTSSSLPAPSLPYRIVRFAVEAAWWSFLVLPVLLAVCVPAGGTMRYRTPVRIEIFEPSFRIVRTHDGQPTSNEEVLDEVRGVLMVGSGPGIGNWVVLGTGYVVVLVVLGLVRTIVRSLREAPFDRRNALRIRWIALILLAFQVALPFLVRLQSSWVAESFHVDGARLSVPTTISVTGFLYPLLLLVLAEVFQRGARIEEEQSLTV